MYDKGTAPAEDQRNNEAKKVLVAGTVPGSLLVASLIIIRKIPKSTWYDTRVLPGSTEEYYCTGTVLKC